MVTEVDSPEHYQFGQLEAWDIIELAIEGIKDPVTAYHGASALKYLLRAARKGGDTDIAKASAHLNRETARHAKAAQNVAACPPSIAEHFALNYGFVPGDVSAHPMAAEALRDADETAPGDIPWWRLS